MSLIAQMLIGWCVIAAIWLLVMPKETRGKAWHYVHAAVPLVILLITLGLGEGPLRGVFSVWLTAGIVILLGLIVTWAIGTALRNHGIMDVAYPLLPFAAACFMAYLFRANFTWWSALLVAMAAAWSLRLAFQTFHDNIGAEREPYATWRKRNGSAWLWWSFFQIHLLQGVLIWIWCAPFAFAFGAPSPQPAWIAVVGLLVWLTGFLFQSLADLQLRRFKSNPANRGGLLETGVWNVMRQPNYFGESVMWWGYFMFAIAHPYGFMTIVCPLYVTWFMGYGSAGRFKEMHMSRTRPEAWAKYVAHTPRFFPWPRPVK